jgi:hypothetical protein
MQKNNNTAIKVFPNPSSDFVNVQSEADLGNVCIYDITGKLLFQNVAVGNKIQFPTKELSNGIYILKTDEYVGKIIKQ